MATLRRSGRKKATNVAPTLAVHQESEVDAMDVDWDEAGAAEEETQNDDDDDFKVAKKKASGSSNTRVKGKGKKRKADDVAAEDASTSGNGNAGSSSAAQPAKRARGKRGLLQNIVELPMDLLFEIFGQLDPYDLVNLSRTSKTLRSILLTKQDGSLSVWKDSLKNVPQFPEPPDDISIPKFVELAFGRNCQFCDKTHPAAIWILWEARVRACSRCLETHHFSGWHSLPSALQSLVPSISIPDRRGGRYRREISYTYGPECEAWLAEFKALSPDARPAWTQEMVEQREKIRAHAQQCETWLQRYKADKETEKGNLAEQRRALVIAHIKKMGWAAEVAKFDNISAMLERNAYVQRACHKDVTERVLHNMEPHLIEFMTEHRRLRLERERKEAIEARIRAIRDVHEECSKHYPPTKALPSAADLFFLPSVYERAMNNVPAPMGPEVAQYIRDNFAELRQEWRVRAEGKLAKVFRDGLAALVKAAKEHNEKIAAAEASGSSSTTSSYSSLSVSALEKVAFEAAEQFTIPEGMSDRDLLGLAVCVFHCSDCYGSTGGNLMAYPRALIHSHARKFSNTLEGEDMVVAKIVNCSAFNCSKAITFDTRTFGSTWKAIKTCGLDPATATPKDMNTQPRLLECVTCNADDVGRMTVKWDALANHHRQNAHTHSRAVDVQALNIADSAKALERMREDFERTLARSSNYGSYDQERCKTACTLCHETGNYLVISNHFKSKHNRSPKDGDIVMMPDCPMVFAPYRLWPPRPSEEFTALFAAASKAVSESVDTNQNDDDIFDWTEEVLGVSNLALNEPGKPDPLPGEADETTPDGQEGAADAEMVAGPSGNVAEPVDGSEDVEMAAESNES